MNKRFLVVCFCVMLGVLAQVPAFAVEASELNDAVLFFVNDPQQLTYADMNLLIERSKIYYRERGILNEDQISKFYQSIQEHGVKNPDTNKAQVAYVVQNKGPEIQGVLVVKGEYDQAKVLETLKKHYKEHSTEHEAAVLKNQSFAKAHGEKAVNPYVEVDMKIDGHNAHVFTMPLRNRELIVVSTNNAILFSSGTKGNRDLLRKTIAVVDGKLPLIAPNPNSKVVMTFSPDKSEKQQMEERIWARYDGQKKDAISQKKHVKRLGERFRQKVIKNKVQFFVEALNAMQEGTLTIERGRANDMTKVATLVTVHEDAEAASEVKKRLMKHLVKEIKSTTDVKDKFAMGNVSIITKDNQTVIRCQMRDSKEQLHCFNLISSYVAEGMLDRL